MQPQNSNASSIQLINCRLSSTATNAIETLAVPRVRVAKPAAPAEGMGLPGRAPAFSRPLLFAQDWPEQLRKTRHRARPFPPDAHPVAASPALPAWHRPRIRYTAAAIAVTLARPKQGKYEGGYGETFDR